MGKPRSLLGCGADAGIVLVQLRPDPDGQPVLAGIAVCPDHVDDVLAFLVETWPHDDVRMMSLETFVSDLMPMHQQAGTPVALAV